MKNVKLGDYIFEYSKKNKNLENIPVYSVTNTLGFCTEYFDKEVASKDKSTYKIVPKGYFAYNPSRINVGSVDWQRNEEKVIVSPLYNVFGVGANLNQQYLYYYLKSKPTLQRIKSVATGSVRDNLKFDMLKEFKIEIGTIEDQKKRVKTLDTISFILNTLHEKNKQLDELVKARFVEMFGDITTNNKCLKTAKGSELFKFSSGKFLPESKRFDSGYPVYGGNGIAWYTNEYLIDYPTIIIGRVGAQCGNIHLTKEPIWITDNAIYIKEQKTNLFTLEFLEDMMKVMNFAQYADYSGQPKITQKPLENTEYLVPSLEEQKEYSLFVQQIDKSKFIIQKQLDETQELFDKLMQDYFE